VTLLKLPEFFLRNYEIVNQFKNFMRNFSGVNFGGVINLAKTISAGALTTLKFQIVVLGPTLFCKGNNPQNYCIAKYLHTILYLNFNQKKNWGILDFISGFSGVIDGEYEAICKTTLACELGPLVELIGEKNEDRKSRANVPLMISFCF
jgi:hypothetical protein